jgi:hypothetical protein
VKARVTKGKGIISRILSILDGIPFGEFYFETAVIERVYWMAVCCQTVNLGIMFQKQN